MSETSNEARKTVGEGYLVVRVSTASGAIPLSGARVTVRGEDEENKDFFKSVYSGASGLTEKIPLPAPLRSLSESPSTNGERPYALYSIDVFSEGYVDLFLVKVPIFDTITSIQGANMIPKPDNEYKDNFAPYDKELREGIDYLL
ncbi:MAG: hypothetical protein IKB02_03060 [Clostridia bacterium]|nr:hypothetical protein [Clostridia bacterium]